MVFSETAQPSFSYYAPVAVCSPSQWTCVPFGHANDVLSLEHHFSTFSVYALFFKNISINLGRSVKH